MARLVKSEMAESARAAAMPCRNIVRRRVSKRAYMRALETEGPHIASPEGEAWWREQERRHPFIMAGGNKPEGTDSPNGHRNRFGKASYRARVVEGRLVRENWGANGWEPARERAAQDGETACERAAQD